MPRPNVGSSQRLHGGQTSACHFIQTGTMSVPSHITTHKRSLASHKRSCSLQHARAEWLLIRVFCRVRVGSSQGKKSVVFDVVGFAILVLCTCVHKRPQTLYQAAFNRAFNSVPHVPPPPPHVRIGIIVYFRGSSQVRRICLEIRREPFVCCGAQHLRCPQKLCALLIAPRVRDVDGSIDVAKINVRVVDVCGCGFQERHKRNQRESENKGERKLIR
jgi:hypothetical protein